MFPRTSVLVNGHPSPTIAFLFIQVRQSTTVSLNGLHNIDVGYADICTSHVHIFNREIASFAADRSGDKIIDSIICHARGQHVGLITSPATCGSSYVVVDRLHN